MTRRIVLDGGEDRPRGREGSFSRTRGIVLKDEEDRPQEWYLTGFVLHTDYCRGEEDMVLRGGGEIRWGQEILGVASH